MIGRTLSFYIAMQFMGKLLAMVVGLAFLIVAVDFIEQLRKVPSGIDVGVGEVFAIALLRTPIFIEKAFPFAVLFAAMMTLTQLNNKMELVVARAAGVSAWQFLLPIGFMAALVGIVVSTVYNPFAIYASNTATELTAQHLLKINPLKVQTKRGLWLKQENENGGYSILNAEMARQNGKLLDNVKIITFSQTGSFVEVSEAKTMEHRGDHWLSTNVLEIDATGKKRRIASEILPTSLTSEELLGINTKPDQVSFWKLREIAERVEKSGTNGLPFLVHYHSLTALPLFLLAMVLVAATVSLRFVRFGQFGRMIFGGILFGFMLYTLTSLITSLGSNGVVPPALAAWAPCLVATLFGTSALLHQEDG